MSARGRSLPSDRMYERQELHESLKRAESLVKSQGDEIQLLRVTSCPGLMAHLKEKVVELKDRVAVLAAQRCPNPRDSMPMDGTQFYLLYTAKMEDDGVLSAVHRNDIVGWMPIPPKSGEGK